MRPGIVTVGVIMLTFGILFIVASLNAYSVATEYASNYQPTYTENPVIISLVMGDSITIQPHSYYNYTLTLDPARVANGSRVGEIRGSYNVSDGYDNASNNGIRLMILDESNFYIWSQRGPRSVLWAQSNLTVSNEFYFEPKLDAVGYIPVNYILVFDNVQSSNPSTPKTVEVRASVTVYQTIMLPTQTTTMRMWTGASLMFVGMLTSISGSIVTLAGIAAKPLEASPLQPWHRRIPPPLSITQLKVCSYCMSENSRDELFCATCGERLT